LPAVERMGFFHTFSKRSWVTLKPIAIRPNGYVNSTDMKRNLVLLIILLLIKNILFAQSTFQRKINLIPGASSDVPTMGILSDGSIITCSRMHSPCCKTNLTKIDVFGNVVWSKKYDNLGDAYGPNEIADGNFVLAGGDTGGLVIAKFDTSGNIIWANSYGDIATSYFKPIETHDKAITSLGWTYSLGAGMHDFYFVKTDSLGNLLWAKSYGGSDADIGQCFTETKDNGFILVGMTTSFNAVDYDLYVIKIDSIGNTIWSKKYGTPASDIPYSVDITPDNGYLISGVSGTWKMSVLKIDSAGTIEWSQLLNYIEGVTYTKVLTNNEILGTGNARDTVAGTFFPCFFKLDSLGNVIWNRVYHNDGSYINCGFKIAPDNSLNFLGVGGGFDTLLVVKTDSLWDNNCLQSNFNIISSPLIYQDSTVLTIVDSGGIMVTSLLPITNITPSNSDGCIPVSINENHLLNNVIEIYPNPFSAEISIATQNQNSRSILITVENILGQTLFSIQKNMLNNAEANKIDLGFLSNGIYLLDIIIDGQRTVKKIVKE